MYIKKYIGQRYWRVEGGLLVESMIKETSVTFEGKGKNSDLKEKKLFHYCQTLQLSK